MDNEQNPPIFPQPPPVSSPPPLGPPPVIVPPVQSAPRRRGRGWMIIALVLLVLLAISVVVNLGQLAGGMVSVAGVRRLGGPRLDEVVLEDNAARNKFAVIDIEGIISSRIVDQGGYSMVDVIKAQLDRAKEDNRVRAVLLRVDSPGGEVLASDEIYRHLVNFQKECPQKPVITSMGDLAASGGYYVASASRWIVANDLTITASIGVILHTWNYRGLMNKVGLQPEVYKSGKFKDMLSGERTADEIPPEEHAMVQALIDETYARFKEVIAEGRDRAHRRNREAGKELASNWKEYADGRILSGTQAYDLGFVDELGNFQDAVSRAKNLAGIAGEVNLIQYRQRYDLSDIFRLFGKSQAPVIKVDLGVDVPKLQAGQLYFLCPTFLH